MASEAAEKLSSAVILSIDSHSAAHDGQKLAASPTDSPCEIILRKGGGNDKILS
jgi:hypothetical protein